MRDTFGPEPVIPDEIIVAAATALEASQLRQAEIALRAVWPLLPGYVRRLMDSRNAGMTDESLVVAAERRAIAEDIAVERTADAASGMDGAS